MPPKVPGHVPRCRTVGLRVVCTCSCGVRGYSARYGNVAGWGYCALYAKQWFIRHLERVQR